MEEQQKKPSISVIIPAYNEADYIEKTLKSVLLCASGYAGHVEIIVVDNNSTDNIGKIASSMEVKVVFEPINQIARARNAGAEQAMGDYLVFVDADTLLEGDILDKVSDNLSSGEVIGGGAWVEPDSKGPAFFIFKYVVNYILALKNVTVGPFLYCEHNAFLHIGGFDEDLYAGEEFALAKRLKAGGKKINKLWKIIKYHEAHRIITSSRRCGAFGVIGMAFKNIHLLWNMKRKLRQKSECDLWYKDR
ncbi:MAG: glycosyltransferase [gamma proteobacterium symbiont of Lucinoma myriamae]|nr:glycosyltransferase [gamma proteobacterium symbiont of Lucinoma myriamae]MCU7819907.1 glycosyltransferase [gamma proteobacterium symbiont of Lucinoma myriamae]MCU7831256.1 glycosyltransferase [gamma proteobacterium symbiont of Lucinoma myriamae]